MNREDINRWVKSLVYSLILFSLFSLYLYLRGGNYSQTSFNRALGSSAVVLAGLTLVIGPLSKKITYFARFISLRREMGLLALGFALAHVAVSLSLQERFPFPAWYLEEVIPVSAGVIAVLIWFYMAYISRDSKILSLGSEVWKKHLSISGKFAFLAVFLHLIILRYESWISWATGQTRPSAQVANPQYPPSSLFVFIIMLLIIVYRLVNDFIYRNAAKEPKVNTPPSNPPVSPPNETI